MINSEIKKILEGNDVNYLSKIEADNYTSEYYAYFDNIETNEKKVVVGTYNKFIFLRNYDKLDEYIRLQIKSFYQEKDAFMAENSDKFDENILKRDELTQEISSISKEMNKLSVYSKEYAELETQKELLDSMRKELKDFNDKYESKIKLLNYRAAVLRDTYNKVKGKIPSIKQIKSDINAHNKSVKNPVQKIKITELFVRADKDGFQFDRLKNGFNFKISTRSNVKTLTSFLKDNYAIFRDNEIVRELGLWIKLKAHEMALIDTNLRTFKNIQRYDDLHKLSFDLETTSAYPAYIICKGCDKKTPIYNKLEIPKSCSQMNCGSTEFSLHNDGQIYIIAIKDNKGFETTLSAINNNTSNTDGKILIDENEERKLIKQFFNIFIEKQPSVIGGYNSENFDFNYILYRAEELGINFDAVKCPKCTLTNEINQYEDEYEPIKVGLMKPIKKGFICSNDEICDFEISNDELNIIYEEKCHSCSNGSIKKGKVQYGCSNFNNCKNRIDISKYQLLNKNNTRQLLSNYVQSTFRFDKPIHKNNYKSILKVGSEIREYYKTNIYGTNVVDRYQMVIRAKAVDSSIKKASLKYISKNHGLKENESRYYVEGKKLFQIYQENKKYIITPNSIYKEIPEEFQDKPNDYLQIVNNSENITNLPDFYDKFFGVIKENNQEYESFDELHKDEIYEENNESYYNGNTISTYEEIESLNDENSDFGYILCRDYYTQYCGNFRVITGKELIDNYALDDVRDDLKVDNQYLSEPFINVRIHPTNFEDFATLGTASAWNLLTFSYCYNKEESIPHKIKRNLDVGGLARTFVTGFSKRIQKADFASLYPSIQLALDVFPNFGFHYLKDMLIYLYERRFYYKKRRKVSSKVQFLEFLKEDNDIIFYNKVINLDENSEEYKNLKSFYEFNSGGNEKKIKVRINSLFGSLGSEIFYGADMDSACMITSSGRLFLRSAIGLFKDFGCKILVCDTDGFNVSIPEKTKFNIINGKIVEIEDLIAFNDITYKEENGVNALIAYYNDKFLPKDSNYMELSDDGEWINCLNIASKNYVNQELDGKIKLTGNTFKSSTLSKFVIELYNDDLKKVLKQETLKPIYDKYIHLANKILTKQIPLIDIVKIRNVKETISEYDNRPPSKNGNKPAKKAHMELLKLHNKKANLDDKVAFINNGLKKSDGDADIIDIKEEKALHHFQCNKCGNLHKNIENVRPKICGNKLKTQKDIKPIIIENFFNERIIDGFSFNKIYRIGEYFSIKGKIYKVLKDFNSNEIDLKHIQKLDVVDLVKVLNISLNKDYQLGDLVKYEDLIYENAKPIIIEDEYFCDSTSMTEKKVYVCLNPNCKKKHILDISEDLSFCSSDGSCDSNEFELLKEQIIVGSRPVSYLIELEELEKNPSLVGDYNVELYMKILNDKMKPLLVCFKPEIRHKILINKLEDIKLFNFQDKDFEMVRENRDSLDELFIMPQNEIDFWNRVKKNPKEIFDKIHIPQPLPHCDDFNDFFDKLEKKSQGTDYIIKRSKRFASDNEYYLVDEGDKYSLYKRKMNEENDKLIKYYKK